MHRARIIRTGDTTMIELPDDLAARLNLSDGDTVELEESEDTAALVIWLSTANGRSEVEPDRAQLIEEIIERRRAMLESLAQR